MTGNKYWSTGIIIDYDKYGNLWIATAEFYDSGFCQSESTEGKLYSRYWAGLEIVIDNVKADVEKLGIVWLDGGQIMAKNDGEEMPANWKEMLKEQADRIGFTFPYNMDALEQ